MPQCRGIGKNELLIPSKSPPFPVWGVVGTDIDKCIIKDPPREGHCMLDLSIGDTIWGPKNYHSLYFLFTENLREEHNLSIMDKTAEFILSPKCPLFGGSTVLPTCMYKSIIYSPSHPSLLPCRPKATAVVILPIAFHTQYDHSHPINNINLACCTCTGQAQFKGRVS